MMLMLGVQHNKLTSTLKSQSRYKITFRLSLWTTDERNFVKSEHDILVIAGIDFDVGRHKLNPTSSSEN